MTLAEARTDLIALVRDDTSSLDNPSDYNLCLRRALQTYSQKWPNRLVQEMTTDDEGVIDTADIDSFDEGYVDRLKIEYPLQTEGAPLFLTPEEWLLYDDEDGNRVIRIISEPDPNDASTFVFIALGGTFTAPFTVRIHHTASHVLPAEAAQLTVRLADQEAVLNEAVYEAFGMLSNLYTQTVDKSSGADFVMAEKGDSYGTRAKAYHQMYFDHVSNGLRRANQNIQVVRA